MYSSISVVVPVYNSSKSINELCSRLSRILAAITEKYEIIMVDDGSKDDSFVQMKETQSNNAAVKIIRLENNFGQQNAIICGLRNAKGDFVITIDDDLQNPPEEIEVLMKAVQNDFEVVYGIPKIRKHSITRNIGSSMADMLFDIICGKPKDIRVSSFRVMRRNIVDKVVMDKSSFVYISAIILKYTKNISNVTVKHESRKYGDSNYSIKKLLKLFYNIYINYSKVGELISRDNKPQYVIKEMYM